MSVFCSLVSIIYPTCCVSQNILITLGYHYVCTRTNNKGIIIIVSIILLHCRWTPNYQEGGLNPIYRFRPSYFLICPKPGLYFHGQTLRLFICLMIQSEKWFCSCFNTGQIVNYHCLNVKCIKPSKDNVSKGP